MAAPAWSLRLDEATRGRWESAAAAAGQSLGEFVRSCVEAKLTPVPGGSGKRSYASDPRVKKAK